MPASSPEPSELVLIELVEPTELLGMGIGWDYLAVELSRSQIDELLDQMDDVAEFADRHTDMESVSFDAWASTNVFTHPRSSSKQTLRHQPFLEALKQVPPEYGEERVRVPASLPKPELDIQQVVSSKALVSAESEVNWKLLPDGPPHWFHTASMSREELKRIHRKLSCYEMKGKDQLQELEAIAEDDAELFDEILEDGRQLLLTRGTTNGWIPVDWLLDRVEIGREDVLELIQDTDRQVRQSGILLAQHMDMGLEEVPTSDQKQQGRSRR